MTKANRALTPGSFDPLATKEQVCNKNYAKNRRPNIWQSLTLKGQALRRYGLSTLNPLNWHNYTLDHLVPLELGGLSNLNNLWPQPKAEALMKDDDENAKRLQVCTSSKTLAQAQQDMIDKWTGA